MLVNFFKLKNISNRGRVISLSVVGGVFVLLVLVAIWSRSFADTLVRYVPNDTSLYAHFSRPKIKDSKMIDSILLKILSDMGLNDYRALNISREVALIGQSNGEGIEYGVIIKSDRPSSAKQVIEEAGLSYKFLSPTRIVIASDDLLSGYELNRDNKIATTIKRKFSAFNTLSVYIDEKIVENYNDDLLLGFIYNFSKNENGNLLLNIQARRDGLKIFSKSTSRAVSDFDYFKVEAPDTDIEGDIVLSISNLSQLVRSWRDNLRNISEYDSDIFDGSALNKYLSTYLNNDIDKLALLIKRNENNTGWMLADYDFHTSIENISIDMVEDMLKVAMASRYPTIKSVYLSDGTRVRELRPNPEQFEFVSLSSAQGVFALPAPDSSVVFMYKVDGNNIVISNNRELIDTDFVLTGDNYLKFNADILPVESIWRYLGEFNSLEVDKRGLILR
jgi:hypothetical protein